MQFALLPLDERPANTRYPTHVAAIAGVDLVLPPDDAMPFMKRPADWKRLVDWLSDRLNGCDGIVASIDLLGYGGLINSRISDDDIPTVLRAIAPLTTMRTTSRPVFAFNVIQRISNANDATEEPNYWAEYGTRLFALSQQAEGPRSEVEDKKVSDSQRPYDPTAPRPPLEGSHRATYMSGHEVKAKSRITETDIPQSILTDWRTRRARNHAVNLAMLHAAALGKFDLLIISSDDTSPIGLSARERKHLEFWRDALFPPLTPTSSSNGGRTACSCCR